MDSITQAALGAALGGAVAGKVLGRKALIAGAVLGTLPDLDVVIDYGTAVANFTQHRGFSHSLLVLVPLAVILGWLLHRWQPRLPYRQWLLLTGLVLVTHPLLDSLTTYGTQLFCPLGRPVAINSIFIIDPLYTLPLLVPLFYSLWQPGRVRPLIAGLVLSTAYLGWTLVAQQIITNRIDQELAARGLENAPALIQPMPFTSLLWRATVLAGDQRLEIVTGLFDGDIPLSVERFPRNPSLAAAAAGLPEGQRLLWFTRGFLAFEQRDGRLLATDIRLGLPGAHPFTFVLAEDQGNGWQPASSYRLPRPAVGRQLLTALWQRASGEAPILCLATLEVRPVNEPCS